LRVRARFAYLDSPQPLAFAHRGGAAGGLENTMTAFARAVDLGYRYVETDVRLTADGVLVAFHDQTLDRMTDRRGRIAELPWREVRAARIHGADGTEERIPAFDDLLAAWPHLRVNVEPKSGRALGPLAEAVRRFAAVERICVGAFADRRLRWLRAELGPTLCTSLGSRETARLKLTGRTPTGAGAVQVPVRFPLGRYGVPVIDPRFLTLAHDAGLQLHAWTIDVPAEMIRLLDLGVDGIMTDRPELLRDVLRARGQWSG
jgi:glycerophosphoryl diester phosphodiesterase